MKVCISNLLSLFKDATVVCLPEFLPALTSGDIFGTSTKLMKSLLTRWQRIFEPMLTNSTSAPAVGTWASSSKTDRDTLSIVTLAVDENLTLFQNVGVHNALFQCRQLSVWFTSCAALLRTSASPITVDKATAIKKTCVKAFSKFEIPEEAGWDMLQALHDGLDHFICCPLMRPDAEYFGSINAALATGAGQAMSTFMKFFATTKHSLKEVLITEEVDEDLLSKFPVVPDSALKPLLDWAAVTGEAQFRVEVTWLQSALSLVSALADGESLRRKLTKPAEGTVHCDTSGSHRAHISCGVMPLMFPRSSGN